MNESFSEWISLTESVSITHINPEEDWEHAEEAWQIARMCHINPGSQKEPTIVAMVDGQVVGAAFTTWSRDHDATEYHGSPVNRYEFDVVVDKRYRWGRTIGLQLIQAAENEKRSLEAEMGENFYTRLWVVNPHLAQFLQGDHKWGGYDVEAEHGDGSAHLVKWR